MTVEFGFNLRLSGRVVDLAPLIDFHSVVNTSDVIISYNKSFLVILEILSCML